MTLRYEDTVTPETDLCTDCGVLVDELDINKDEFACTGEWICPDCGEARLERRMEREAGFA